MDQVKPDKVHYILIILFEWQIFFLSTNSFRSIAIWADGPPKATRLNLKTAAKNSRFDLFIFVIQAIKDIKRALSLDENNGNAWFNLSFAYNQSGNYKAALEAAQMAKAKNYPVNEAYLNGLIQKSR